MELLLRHRGACDVPQGHERAVQEILHLQDLREIAQHLDDAEVLPALQRHFEDVERALVLGVHLLRLDPDLVGELLEAHVVVVFLHRHAAGEPFRVRRWRELDRRLVEYRRAVKLVERVAAHDLAHRGLVFLGLLAELLYGLDGRIGGHDFLREWDRRKMLPGR